jgi:hypothetical protein
MFSNCGRASSYQKSWTNATPRLKLARTDGEHDTGNDTVPKCSPGGGTSAPGPAAPAVSGERAMQTRNAIQTDARVLMAWILSIRPMQGAGPGGAHIPGPRSHNAGLTPIGGENFCGLLHFVLRRIYGVQGGSVDLGNGALDRPLHTRFGAELGV